MTKYFATEPFTAHRDSGPTSNIQVYMDVSSAPIVITTGVFVSDPSNIVLGFGGWVSVYLTPEQATALHNILRDYISWSLSEPAQSAVEVMAQEPDDIAF